MSRTRSKTQADLNSNNRSSSATQTNGICQNGSKSNDENYSQVVARFSRFLDVDCGDLCFASARAEP